MALSFTSFNFGPQKPCLDCERLERLIDGIDLAGFPIPIAFRVVSFGDSHGIGAALHVRDRSRPRDVIEIHNSEKLEQPFTDRDVLAAARTAVTKLVEHELLEQLKFRGERIFDPHSAFSIQTKPAPPPPPPVESLLPKMSLATIVLPPPPPSEGVLDSQKMTMTLTLNGREFPVTDFNFKTKKSFDSRARIKKLKRRR